MSPLLAASRPSSPLFDFWSDNFYFGRIWGRALATASEIYSSPFQYICSWSAQWQPCCVCHSLSLRNTESPQLSVEYLNSVSTKILPNESKWCISCQAATATGISIAMFPQRQQHFLRRPSGCSLFLSSKHNPQHEKYENHVMTLSTIWRAQLAGVTFPVSQGFQRSLPRSTCKANMRAEHILSTSKSKCTMWTQKNANAETYGNWSDGTPAGAPTFPCRWRPYRTSEARYRKWEIDQSQDSSLPYLSCQWCLSKWHGIGWHWCETVSTVDWATNCVVRDGHRSSLTGCPKLLCWGLRANSMYPSTPPVTRGTVHPRCTCVHFWYPIFCPHFGYLIAAKRTLACSASSAAFAQTSDGQVTSSDGKNPNPAKVGVDWLQYMTTHSKMPNPPVWTTPAWSSLSLSRSSLSLRACYKKTTVVNNIFVNWYLSFLHTKVTRTQHLHW